MSYSADKNWDQIKHNNNNLKEKTEILYVYTHINLIYDQDTKTYGRPWVDETMGWVSFVCLFVMVHNIDQMTQQIFFWQTQLQHKKW